MISIRKDTCNGRPRIQAFRKFERSYSLGSAWQTPSGKWIIIVGSQPFDAFDTEKEARAALKRMVIARA